MPAYYDSDTDPYYAATADADSHPYGTVGGLPTTASVPSYMDNYNPFTDPANTELRGLAPEPTAMPSAYDWAVERQKQGIGGSLSSGEAAALISGENPATFGLGGTTDFAIPGWTPKATGSSQGSSTPKKEVGRATNPTTGLITITWDDGTTSSGGTDPNWKSTGGGGGGKSPVTTSDGGTAALLAAQAAAQKAANDAAKQNAIATLKGIFNTYGLSSLYGKIEQYVQQGYSGDTVAIMLRAEPEYAARFPAMAELASKGRAISEAAYIDYERTAAQFEKQYGLPSGMLTGNVTNLLKNDISATEMAERVQMAASNSLLAPQELKDTLSKYYGISGGGLAAYFLDPTIAEPILQKQAAAARIGSEALRQGIGMDVYGAENLQSLGVSQEQARQGFQQVAGARELFSGVGDLTSEQEMISGLLAGNQEAMAGVQRAAGARKARFQQGGEYLATSGGAVGLGTAATT